MLVAVLIPSALAQPRPYIGYAYPAGGQQGTTVLVRLGGQNTLDVSGVIVTGPGVTASVAKYYRRLNNEEVQLLNEQLKRLKQATSAVASTTAPMMKAEPAMSSQLAVMMSAMDSQPSSERSGKEESVADLVARIEDRLREHVPTPACVSISGLVFAKVVIAPDAPPGARQIRIVTPRGVSNPLVFHIGQLPEYTRKAMVSATLPVLGKEAQALRKRPTNEVEVQITLPCTLNGQIASGEINRYRFHARKGQRLVAQTLARQLVPYIADAVPGWFQPVLTLYDAQGRELAFADDYQFKPDPVLFFEVPADGEYVLAVSDALYRGREDFVYRITLGELPFITSVFPLGARAGALEMPKMRGWNLEGAILNPAPEAVCYSTAVAAFLPDIDAQGRGETGLAGSGLNAASTPGRLTLRAVKNGLVSNPVWFALDSLPEVLEREPNNAQTNAQKLTLPVIINGRIDRPDDWDVFEFTGKSNQLLAAEVIARRLDSPLDSVIKLTDAQGRLLALSDDREDLSDGLNTHHADSWFTARLPTDGTYFLHVGDVARQGGPDYGYRLRLSAPQPDFELRVVPSSVSVRTNASAALTVFAQRKDAFTGPIRLTLKEPPPGFSATPVTLTGTQTVAQLTIKGPSAASLQPVWLRVVGTAKVGTNEIVREAVPAEDRMQAFLWRQLLPARELLALVFDPGYTPPPKRIPPVRPPAGRTNELAVVAAAGSPGAETVARTPSATNALAGTNLVPGTNKVAGTNMVASATAPPKPKFTKQQVASRLRQLKLLYDEGLLTDDFYCEKVAECETVE